MGTLGVLIDRYIGACRRGLFAVNHLLVKLRQPRPRDSAALLLVKRIFARQHFDQRAHAVIAKMGDDMQVECVGIRR